MNFKNALQRLQVQHSTILPVYSGEDALTIGTADYWAEKVGGLPDGELAHQALEVQSRYEYSEEEKEAMVERINQARWAYHLQVQKEFAEREKDTCIDPEKAGKVEDISGAKLNLIPDFIAE